MTAAIEQQSYPPPTWRRPDTAPRPARRRRLRAVEEPKTTPRRSPNIFIGVSDETPASRIPVLPAKSVTVNAPLMTPWLPAILGRGDSSSSSRDVAMTVISAKLGRIRRAEHGWNGPGSRALTDPALRAFAQFIRLVRSSVDLDAEPVLTTDGGLTVDWSSDSRGEASIDFDPDGSLWICSEDLDRAATVETAAALYLSHRS